MMFRIVLAAVIVVLSSSSLHVFLHGGELPQVTPEEVGFNPERLLRLSELTRSYVDKSRLPGVLTVVARRGQIAHMEVVGYRDVEASLPLELNSIFRIYSMTKPVTSVAVMILYEEGKIRLGAPVSNYIPELEGLKVLVAGEDGLVRAVETDRPVTVQDLLRHTSGLSYGIFSDTYVDGLYREAELLSTDRPLKEFVAEVAKSPLAFQPGERWHYGISTDVLGYLVEVVSGQPLDEFLKSRIFEPLNMTDTGFFVPAEKIERFTTCYGPDLEAMKDSNGRIIMKAVDERTSSRFTSKPKLLSGGGGLVSTARDYLRFLQMLLNKGELDGNRVLSPKTVEYMTIDHVPPRVVSQDEGDQAERGFGFGLGFAVLKNPAGAAVVSSKGEFNWAGYASTLFWVDPSEELIGLMLTQFIPSSTYPLGEEMRSAVYQALVD